MRERQPLAGAVGIETCHIQRAVVEQFAIRLSRSEAGAGRAHAVAADELVDVLEARVFAGIDHGAPIARQCHPRAFVGGAPERGALDGRGRRVHRIDLDDPAKAVELVRVLHRIEALVVFGPAIKTVSAQAPAPLVRVEVVAAVEVEREVFFA